MKSPTAKNKIIELYNTGLNAKEIAQVTGYKLSLIRVHINKYDRKATDKNGFFNVNKLECWIFPSSKVN